MAAFNPVRALERGLDVLMAVNERDGMRAQDIAAMTDIPRPTVYRLLETLEAAGFVMRGPSDDGWRPTIKVHCLSAGFLDKAWIGQVAMPEMVRLGQKIIWPLDLVTYADQAMEIRATTHKFSPFSFDVGMVGKRVPLFYTAGGQAYFSFCPEAEREAILDTMRASPHPEHAIARDPERIARLIEQTRARGYGVRSEAYGQEQFSVPIPTRASETCSISVPILTGGKVLACLTVVWLRSAMRLEEFERRHAAAVQAAAEKIGRGVEAAERTASTGPLRTADDV